MLAMEVQKTKVTEVNVGDAHLISGTPDLREHIVEDGAHSGEPCGLPGGIIPSWLSMHQILIVQNHHSCNKLSLESPLSAAC